MKVQMFVPGTGCYGKHCPAVYKTDRGTFVVQGNLINGDDMANFSLALHEGVVEIPETLVRALAGKLEDKQ